MRRMQLRLGPLGCLWSVWWCLRAVRSLGQLCAMWRWTMWLRAARLWSLRSGLLALWIIYVLGFRKKFRSTRHARHLRNPLQRNSSLCRVLDNRLCLVVYLYAAQQPSTIEMQLTTDKQRSVIMASYSKQ
ncbi:uncharacterized protein LOC115562540 [Drosophila navojoa]|uniref:uncharacterized protein LOC115562540 n=1 Tax=Drosophila navojoa TaxID=7232 RepID=UPI0011BD8D0F|nr:uncharacterized protein LOC115562540 [Drosophila navojoa]